MDVEARVGHSVRRKAIVLWDTPRCMTPVVRKFIVSIRAKQQAQKTAATRISHNRGRACGMGRGLLASSKSSYMVYKILVYS